MCLICALWGRNNKIGFLHTFVCYTLYIVYATLYIRSNFILFRICILCTFRKFILSHTSDVHFLIFRSLYVKWWYISAEYCSTQMGTRLKNMTILSEINIAPMYNNKSSPKISHVKTNTHHIESFNLLFYKRRL